YLKNRDSIIAKNIENEKKYYNTESYKARKRKWREENPEKSREYTKNSYIKHADKRREEGRAYYEENKNTDEYRKQRQEYRSRKRARETARQVARELAKSKATPEWLTDNHLNEINMYYKEATRLKNEDGIPRDVDHIVPIKGKE